jgi:phage/plasmid-associated DNA primase
MRYKVKIFFSINLEMKNDTGKEKVCKHEKIVVNRDTDDTESSDHDGDEKCEHENDEVSLCDNIDNNSNSENDSQSDEEIERNMDKFIETQEVFDVNVANYILEHVDDFDLQCDNSYGITIDPINALKKYVHMAIVKNSTGFERVTYKQNNGKGRYYAVGDSSLQSLSRGIRHTISKDFYKDIDIVNCHPVLLEWMCKQNNFKCKYLSMYIANREKYINGNPLKKTLYLIMTNEGGRAIDLLLADFDLLLTDFEAKYWNEMKTLHKLFSELYPKDYEAHKKKRIRIDRKNHGHKASFMNTLLCDLENRVLMCMWEFYGNPKDAVLCFDSIMVRKRDDEKYDLEECEKYIESNIGITISLKIKEMTQGLDLIDCFIKPCISVPHEKQDKYSKIVKMFRECIKNNCIDNGTLSLIFVEMMKDEIVVINRNGDGFQWNSERKLWLGKYANLLMDEIRNEDNLIFKAVESAGSELKLSAKKHENDNVRDQLEKNIHQIKKALHSVRHIQNIFSLSRNKLLNEDFKTKIINRQHIFFPISDGKIIDLQTGEIRDRIKSDYFSFESPVHYIPEDEWCDIDKYELKKFIDPIFVNDAEYIDFMRIKLGSYLCGNVSGSFDIFYGVGENGMSYLIKALKIILNEFSGYVGKNIVSHNSRQYGRKIGCDPVSHLSPIEGKRLIFTDELQKHDIIDSGCVEEMMNLDDIKGTRKCYDQKTTIAPFCKFIITTNTQFIFDPDDISIIDRLLICPFNARFMDDREIRNDKVRGSYDEAKFKYYSPDIDFMRKYCVAGRNIDIFFSWLIGGCVEFYAKYNDDLDIPKPPIVLQCIEQTRDKNDIITAWIGERCEIIAENSWDLMTSKDRKKYQTLSSELCKDFDNWAKGNRINCGKNKFIELMNSRFTCRRINGEYMFERLRIIESEIDDESEICENSNDGNETGEQNDGSEIGSETMPNDMKNILLFKKNDAIYKKIQIPKALRYKVWTVYIGEKEGYGKCYVCDGSITPFNYECGHIIAEKNGGPTNLSNLRPVCSGCNKSVGTKNMDEFKRMYMR